MDEIVSPEFYELLREGLQASEHGNYGQAIRFWEQALALNPRHPQLLKLVELANQKLAQKTDELPRRKTDNSANPPIGHAAEPRGKAPATQVSRSNGSSLKSVGPVNSTPTIPSFSRLRAYKPSRFIDPPSFLTPLILGAILITAVIIGITVFKHYAFSQQLDAGLVAFYTGDYLTAVRNFKAAVTNNPQSQRALLSLIGSYFLLDDYQEALEWSDKFANRFGLHKANEYVRYLFLLELNNRQLALTAITNAWKLDPLDPRIRLAYARELTRNGHEHQAIPILLSVFDENPAILETYSLLYQCFNRLELQTLGQSWLEAALLVNPTIPEMYLTLAENYSAHKLTSRALALLKSCQRIPEMSSSQHLALARLFSELNHPEVALAEYDLALLLDHSNSLLFLEKAQLQLNLNRKIDAEKVLKAGLELDPQSPDIHLALARLYFATHRFKSAATHFETAYEKVKEDHALLNDLAETYLALGRPAKAKETFSLSLALNPEQPAITTKIRNLN